MTLMELLRVRLGLESDDSSKDVDIGVSKDSAFALMGSYCDRIFPLATDGEETFTHHAGVAIPLKHYPITSISSIVDVDNKEITSYHFEADSGLVFLDAHWAFHQVVVTSTGGYSEDALPPDLLVAFLSVFDQEYDLVSGGSAPSAAGTISSVTVVDVGTVRYNDTEASSSGEGAYLPTRAQSILEHYKRYKC